MTKAITKKMLVFILAITTLLAFTPVLALPQKAQAATGVGIANGGTIDASNMKTEPKKAREQVAEVLGVSPDRVSIDSGARKIISVRLTKDVKFASATATVTVVNDTQLDIDLNGYNISSADSATEDMFNLDDGTALRIINGQSLAANLTGAVVEMHPAADGANIIEATGNSDITGPYSQNILIGQGVTAVTGPKSISNTAKWTPAINIVEDGTADSHASVIVQGTVIGGHKNVGAIVLGPSSNAKATIAGIGTAFNTAADEGGDYAVQVGTKEASFSKSHASTITAIGGGNGDPDTAVGVKIVPTYYQNCKAITDINVLKNDMYFQWLRYDAATDTMTVIKDAADYYYTPTKADKGYYIMVQAWAKSEYDAGLFGFACSRVQEPVIDTKAVSNVKYTIKNTSAVGVSAVSKNVKKYTIAKTASIGGGTFKVTAINARAFAKATKCKTVTIKSKTITRIGKNAFKKCKNGLTFKLPKAKYSKYKKMLKKSGLPKNVKFKKI